MEIQVGSVPGKVELVLHGERIKAARMDKQTLIVKQYLSGSGLLFDGQFGSVIDMELESIKDE